MIEIYLTDGDGVPSYPENTVVIQPDGSSDPSAFADVRHIADGVSDTFSIPFPYLDATHIRVYVNGEMVPTLTFPTQGQVTLPDVPPTGSLVVIRRNTPKTRLVDFQNASMLDAALLDLDANQLMYVVQENFDKNKESITLDLDDAFDAKGRRIKNLREPEAANDAVTKKFADGVITRVDQIAQEARNVEEFVKTKAREIDEIKKYVERVTQPGEIDCGFFVRALDGGWLTDQDLLDLSGGLLIRVDNELGFDSGSLA